MTSVVRRSILVCVVGLTAWAAGSCAGSATAPADSASIAAGPLRDLNAQIQTDTTIYHATLQGSQWVVTGSTVWTIPGAKSGRDTVFGYVPCHAANLDAVVTVERESSNDAPVSFSQPGGCEPLTYRALTRGQQTTIFFTITAPADAPIAQRTGHMRIRFVLCALGIVCVPVPTANVPVSNTFDVR